MYSFNRLPYYKNDKELAGLHILKFICAIMIVQIHSYSVIGKYLIPLCRIAVPIFFIISGYFIVSCDGTIYSKKIINSSIKIFKISLFAILSYICYDVLTRLVFNENFECYHTASYWINEILFGTSARAHLWYLTSYLQTLLAIIFFIKAKIFPITIIAIPIGITLNLLIGSYGFLMFEENNSLLFSRNAITIAIPSVMIGMFIRIHEHRIPSQQFTFIFLIISIVALYFEHVFVEHRTGDIIIMTLPVAIMTFITFMRFNISDKFITKIVEWGKEYSLDIYLWHPMVAAIYGRIQNYMGFYPGVNTLVIALITLGISIHFKPTTWPSKCYKHFRSATIN